MFVWDKGKRGDLRVQEWGEHLQVHILWVFVYVCFRPMGHCMGRERERERPTAVFPLIAVGGQRVRGETFNHPSLLSHHPFALCHGDTARPRGEKWGRREPISASHPLWFELQSLSLPLSSTCLSFYFSRLFPLKVAALFEVCRVCLFLWVTFELMNLLWWSNRVVMKRGG